MSNTHFKFLKQKERKKILLISDDLRVPSGIGSIAKEIVTHTSHHFNWVNIAGTIKHPEKGKIIDYSSFINKKLEINDAYVRLYPVDGYGNPSLLREIIGLEKPDAIMLFTDPRQFIWVFDMENEIRKNIPITYLNIWDSLPHPSYNNIFYESCDLLMGISKQTVNINKMALQDNPKKIIKYIPHGKDPNSFKPLDPNDKELLKFKKQLLDNKEANFIIFFNSRNIRRKQIPDTLLAFKGFLDTLPLEEAQKCFIVLHTELISDAGTDLEVVTEYIFGEKYEEQVIFSLGKFHEKQLNYLYNIADIQVLASSNEGWGLSLTEALLAGTPFIANVTGGMQDQMRFSFYGEWIDFTPGFPSNHRKTMETCGEWAFPVYPSCNSMQGSPVTPYIFDDRCKWEDISEQMRFAYTLGREKLKELGKKGRKWAISEEAGFTSKHQAKRIIKAFDELFEKWEPREEYEILNANSYKNPVIPHKINY